MTSGPRRTCVACREVREKRQLVRLVRLPEGTVVVDAAGRAPGRGAYVCRSTGCAARLAKGGRLSQAFKRPSAPAPTLVGALERDDSGVGENLSGVGREGINVIWGR